MFINIVSIHDTFQGRWKEKEKMLCCCIKAELYCITFDKLKFCLGSTQQIFFRSTAVSHFNRMANFDKWMEQHNNKPSEEAQMNLVEYLIKLSDEKYGAPIQPSEEPCCQHALRSWNGVNIGWLKDVLLQTPEMKTFREYGCQMWFVRNQCITKILRRRGVTTNGSIIDHVERFKTKEESYGHNLSNSVSSSSCFISYTGEISLEQFTTLISHRDLLNKYVWLDIICVCQFSWTERKDDEMAEFKENFLSELREQVGKIRFTALLLSEWHDLMTTVGKIWVLWELFSSVIGKARVELLFTDSAERRFVEEALLNVNNLDGIRENMAKIDAKEANAFDPQDKERIHCIMEKNNGISKVNQTVLECLRSWFLEQAEKQYDNIKSKGIDVFMYRKNLALLYTKFADFSQAERIIREDIEVYTPIFGAKSKEILGCQTRLTGMLHMNGTEEKKADAINIIKDVVVACEELYPTEDVFVKALTMLAVFYHGGGRFHEAEIENRKALNVSTTLHGSDHQYTLTIMDHLSENLVKQKKFSEANPIIKKVVDCQTDQLGPRHEWTLNAKDSLAGCLTEEGMYAEAEEHYKEIIRVSTEQQGLENEFTLIFRANYAKHLSMQNDKKEIAEGEYRNLVETVTRVIGDHHPLTLTCLDGFCTVLGDLGRREESDRIYANCYEKCCENYGPDHPLTLQLMHSRVTSLLGQDRKGEAINLANDVYLKLVHCFSESHPRTLDAQENLKNLEMISEKVVDASKERTA